MNNNMMCELIEVLTIKKGENPHNYEVCWKTFYDECLKSLRAIVCKKHFEFNADWTQEDYEHDVMLKVFDKMDSYDSKCGHFITWFSTLSTRIYYKKYNKAKNEMANGNFTIPMYIENNDNDTINIIDHYKYSTSVEKDYFYNISSDKLYNAIANLKDNYRNVVMLCDIQGIKPKDAAKILGCKSEDVYRWLTRAHASLKTFIINEEMEEDLSYEYEL